MMKMEWSKFSTTLMLLWKICHKTPKLMKFLSLVALQSMILLLTSTQSSANWLSKQESTKNLNATLSWPKLMRRIHSAKYLSRRHINMTTLLSIIASLAIKNYFNKNLNLFQQDLWNNIRSIQRCNT